MPDADLHHSLVEQLLPQAVAGDQAALNALLRHCENRFTALTRRMLGDFRRVRRWMETDDILQNALVRLVKSLQHVKPASPRDFLALAALQIRRELIDLARRCYGPQGIGANHDSVPNASPDPADGGEEPSALAQWTELHEQIGKLPDDEREVVDLLFYQGLSQAEAAAILGISMRTVQRRWHAVLFKLHRVWNREM